MRNPIHIGLKYTTKLYRKSLRSIALYPVFISLLFFLVAICLLYAEQTEFARLLKKKVPYFLVQDLSSARTILSVIIGGILSLTVFSFTMVMGVLNQASSNFSPRLLPKLVSNKKHQIILGFYVGTLLYCLVILLSLGAYGVASEAMGLTITVGALFGVGCVALFVYFIHTISGAIQIHNIVQQIFLETSNLISLFLEKNEGEAVGLKSLEMEGWISYPIDKTGYYGGVDLNLMEEDLFSESTQISILPYRGQHLWKYQPVIKSQIHLSKEQLTNLILCMTISSNRQSSDTIVDGFLQLMEIAVKAMSPGINDPETAIQVISKIGQLMDDFINLPTVNSRLSGQKRFVLLEHTISINEILRKVIQPIRFYAKDDINVLYELAVALEHLTLGNNLDSVRREAVTNEIMRIKSQINKVETFGGDKDTIQSQFFINAIK